MALGIHGVLRNDYRNTLDFLVTRPFGSRTHSKRHLGRTEAFEGLPFRNPVDPYGHSEGTNTFQWLFGNRTCSSHMAIPSEPTHLIFLGSPLEPVMFIQNCRRW